MFRKTSIPATSTQLSMENNGVPICSGKGLDCAALHQDSRLSSLVIYSFQVFLVIFVLFLSIFKVGDEMLKWYTVLTYIFFLLFATVLGVGQAIQVYSLYYSGLEHIIAEKSIFFFIGGLVRAVTFMQFRTLSLFVVVSYLLAFKTPLFFKNHIVTRRKRIMVYITIMSVCLVLPMTVRQFCVSFVGRCATMIDAKLLLEIHRWISASSVIVFALTTLIAMTMSLAIVLSFWCNYKRNSLGCEATRRKSVLEIAQFTLYFVPLTLAQFSFFGSALLFILSRTFPQLAEKIPKEVSEALFRFAVDYDEYFTIVLPLCTLSALSPYRRAVIQMLSCAAKKTNTVPIWAGTIRHANNVRHVSTSFGNRARSRTQTLAG
ncbi:hypothetical protein Tcan_11305 [Toxocara canis]|uniref:Serpentine receptor class gamma n=1 Tax=Toxocara canis TaxID=6265 RepID=A0A0B2W211_TOXCA|nr:hypothetical protein Tcan_11305 [Toxocara canis]